MTSERRRAVCGGGVEQLNDTAQISYGNESRSQQTRTGNTAIILRDEAH